MIYKVMAPTIVFFKAGDNPESPSVYFEDLLELVKVHLCDEVTWKSITNTEDVFLRIARNGNVIKLSLTKLNQLLAAGMLRRVDRENEQAT